MSSTTERALMPAEPVAGARNLLEKCMGLAPGHQLLIVAEPDGSGHYDAALAPFIAQQATSLGAKVAVQTLAPGKGPEDVPDFLFEAIGAASHTLFLNRIGDQLRFRPLPGAGVKSISYTLDMGYLGSAFAVAPHRALEELHRRVLARLAASTRYSIRCALGSSLSMDCGALLQSLGSVGGFTVQNFPVMIVPPVPADRLNGRLVLSHALTSTGIHEYPGSIIRLTSPITLTLIDGQITSLEGESALLAQVEAQLDRVDTLFGGAGRRLGSWHTGINPFTYFLTPALADLDRWSGVSFGSPRYTHFHLCGEPPGDICGQMFDATITFDDTVIWDRGRLALLDAPENADILAELRASAGSIGAPLPLGV